MQITPLIQASKSGHDKCVLQLLQHNSINVSIQDKDGYNCLAVAAKNRHLLVERAYNCHTVIIPTLIPPQTSCFGYCKQ